MPDPIRISLPGPVAADAPRRPDVDGPADRAGGPPTLLALDRHVESMQGRIDVLRPQGDPAEVFEALETTMEELRTAVEQLRATNDALLESRGEVEAERRRYRDLFDQAPDPYLVTDLRGIICEANNAASVALRVEAHFLVGKPLVVFLPAEGRTAFRSELARLPQATSTREYDLRLKPRQLPPFDASVRVGVVRDLAGRPLALRWTVRDVSARRRAEEQVRALNARLGQRVIERSEQLESVLHTNERMLIRAHAVDAEAVSLQSLVDEVDAILWRADAETGRYTFVSRRAEELLGYPPSHWLGEPGSWLARIHPEDRDWAEAHRRKDLREGVGFEAEYRVIAADGRVLWFREIVRLLPAGPHRPAVLCGLMVNISRRKKVERQLYTAKGELMAQLRDLNYLRELGGRLATARGWRQTLDEVLSAVASLLGTEMGMVLIRDGHAGGMVVAAGLGLPEEFTRMVGRGLLDPGPLGRPLASREPVLVEDVEAKAVDPLVRGAARVGGFRALLGVPLFTRDGEFLGAIAAFFHAPHRAPEGQVRLVEMYAEQAAEAIGAARALGRLEEADRRKDRALAEIAAEMRAVLDASRSTDPGFIERRARQLLGLLATFPTPPTIGHEDLY